MNATSMDKDRPNFDLESRDDLTLIKGIGAARQQWLYEIFNVHSYGDLAAISLERIESQLKSEGRPVVRKDIQRWLSQAQELAAIAAQPATTTIATQTPIRDGVAKRQSEMEDWYPFASFTVEFRKHRTEGQPEAFQTAVHHMESDTDALWPSIESKMLCAWILEQIHDNMKSQDIESAPSSSASAIATFNPINIAQVRLFQPASTNIPTMVWKPGQLFYKTVNSTEHFALDVAFHLTEPFVATLTSQSLCSVQFYVHSVFTGVEVALGTSDMIALFPDQKVYTAKLAETSLAPGAYYVEILISLQHAPSNSAYLELPLLRVI